MRDTNEGTGETERRATRRFDLLARFRRDQRGANAVEFGLVAFPFFALFLALLEVCMAFITNQVMDNALRDSARLIRTGQAHAQNFSAARFRDDVCSRITTFMDCQADILIDVRELPAGFGTVPPQPLQPNGALDPTQARFQIGQPNSVIIATAYYDAPTYLNILGASLANAPGGRVRLISTVAFRNEPFQMPRNP